MTASATTARPLPALSQSARLRYATFAALYFAQGIPQGVLAFAVPAWLAMNGKTPAQISAYSAVMLLPWSLKLVAAPLIERYAYLPMGRRRPWLLAGQGGLLLGFGALSLVPDPLHHLPWLTAVAFGVSLLTVVQDIATDSLAIDVVPPAQQGQANSLMWGAKTVGIAATLAATSWLLHHVGWRGATLAPAAAIGLIGLLPLTLRERPGEKRLPWTAGAATPAAARLQTTSWAALLRASRRALLLPNSRWLLVGVFAAQLGQNYFDASLPIFTVQQLGWTDERYAQIYAPAGLVGGLAGMLLGGLLMRRLGVVRVVQGCLLLLGGLAAVLGSGAAWWADARFITGCIGAFCVLNTLIFIGSLALAMQCCWARISAVQFTVYMTVANLGAATGTALVGVARTHLPWTGAYLALAGLVLLPIGVLGLVRLAAHRRQVDELENRHLEQQAAAGLRVAV